MTIVASDKNNVDGGIYYDCIFWVWCRKM